MRVGGIQGPVPDGPLPPALRPQDEQRRVVAETGQGGWVVECRVSGKERRLMSKPALQQETQLHKDSGGGTSSGFLPSGPGLENSLKPESSLSPHTPHPSTPILPTGGLPSPTHPPRPYHRERGGWVPSSVQIQDTGSSPLQSLPSQGCGGGEPSPLLAHQGSWAPAP